MARIRPLEQHETHGWARDEYARQVAAHGRMTHMKRTLAHSPVALRALMEWYALRDEVLPFLGERLTRLFVHAISAETDCLICSTYFRREMIDAGEDPEVMRLDDRERLVGAYGRRLVTDSNGVTEEMYQGLARHFDDRQMVTLTAFGALMVATNVFNNALAVDLDDYLKPYVKDAEAPARPAGDAETSG